MSNFALRTSTTGPNPGQTSGTNNTNSGNNNANLGHNGPGAPAGMGSYQSQVEQYFMHLYGPNGAAYGPRPPFSSFAGGPRPFGATTGSQANSGSTGSPTVPPSPGAGSGGVAPTPGANQQDPLKADIDKLVTDKKLDTAAADVLRGLARVRPNWAKEFIAQATSDSGFNKNLLGAVILEAGDTPVLGQPSAVLGLSSSGYADAALAQKGAAKLFETNRSLLLTILRSTRNQGPHEGWPNLISSLKPFAPAASTAPATPTTPGTPATPGTSTPSASTGSGGQPITINFSPVINITSFTPSGQAVSSTVSASTAAAVSSSTATTAPATASTALVKPATTSLSSAAPVAASNATSVASSSQAPVASKPAVPKILTQAEFNQLIACQTPAIRSPLAFSGLVQKP